MSFVIFSRCWTNLDENSDSVAFSCQDYCDGRFFAALCELIIYIYLVILFVSSYDSPPLYTYITSLVRWL